MPYQVCFNEKDQIVETVYQGLLTSDELMEAAMASLKVAEQHQTTRFLGDCTTLDPGGSLFDIYDLVQFYENIPFARFSKEAILLPQIPQAVEDMQFYELVSQNRGFEVRIFADRQVALDWLLA